MSFLDTEGNPTPKGWCAFIFIIVTVITGIILLFSSFEIINPGERGIVVELGEVKDDILIEGFHFLVPFTQSVVIMDVTVQKYVEKAASASSDLQTVIADIALNYHLDPMKVNSIYQTFRNNEVISLIDPVIQEAVKASTAKYTAEQLITTREVVKDEIISHLKNKLEPYGILVDGVSIINFEFSASFNASIEAKVTAEQDALASKNKLEQTKYEAEQKVVTAKAEAEAIRIAAEAINSQGGEDYVNLKAVQRWNGVLPIQMVPNGALPFINLNP